MSAKPDHDEVATAVAQALMSGRPDAIVAADREGAITFWNPGAERIFGHARDAALGRPLDIIIPERLRRRHADGYRRVMEGRPARYGEADLLAVPAQRSDGATISVEFTIVPMRDAQGTLTGMIAVIRDVTQRFEELRELRRRVCELEASIR
jgi:PAS domain S-box-containing protein